MRTIMLGIASAVLLGACSDDSATQPKPKKAAAASLQPGEYEITAKVDALRSTDQTTPATRSKVGDPAKVARTCIRADGTIDPAVFAESGETCNAMENYMRRGRMSLQYKCNRSGQQLTQMVDGEFKTDSFEGKVMTSTYFSGDGDYELRRTVTGRRVGECTANSQKAAS